MFCIKNNDFQKGVLVKSGFCFYQDEFDQRYNEQAYCFSMNKICS